MKVSVVVACRNEAHTLPACLDALDQQDLPASQVELLFVDGGSTDGGTELLRARGHRILHDPGRGPAAARNLGIEAARGDVVAFTDADCVPRFDWLSSLLRPLREPTVAGVAGALRLPRDTLLGRLEDNDARLRYRGFITSNVAYRRSALLEVGGFDGSLSCAEDYDLAWRLLDAGHRLVHAPDAIVLHDPPEIRSWRAYLAKQFWYAREDVPTHVAALRRGWRAASLDPSARLAAAALGESVVPASFVAAGGAALLARRPGAAALAAGAAAARAAWRVAQGVRHVGVGAREMPLLAAAAATKSLARGAGTLAGLARLAAGAAQRARGGLAARPARSPAPRATMARAGGSRARWA